MSGKVAYIRGEIVATSTTNKARVAYVRGEIVATSTANRARVAYVRGEIVATATPTTPPGSTNAVGAAGASGQADLSAAGAMALRASSGSSGAPALTGVGDLAIRGFGTAEPGAGSTPLSTSFVRGHAGAVQLGSGTAAVLAAVRGMGSAVALPLPRRYAFRRRDLTDDYLRTSGNVGLISTMTCIWYTRLTDTGSAGVCALFGYGWNYLNGDTGLLVRYDQTMPGNTNPVLRVRVGRAGTTAYADSAVDLSSYITNWQELGEHVGWLTINGTALEYGIPALGVSNSATITGGVDPKVQRQAILYFNGSTATLEAGSTAADLGVAVLGDVLSGAQISALAALGERAPMAAVDLSSNPLWCPVPASSLWSYAPINTASTDVVDYAAGKSHVITAGTNDVMLVAPYLDTESIKARSGGAALVAPRLTGAVAASVRGYSVGTISDAILTGIASLSTVGSSGTTFLGSLSGLGVMSVRGYGLTDDQAIASGLGELKARGLSVGVLVLERSATASINIHARGASAGQVYLIGIANSDVRGRGRGQASQAFAYAIGTLYAPRRNARLTAISRDLVVSRQNRSDYVDVETRDIVVEHINRIARVARNRATEGTVPSTTEDIITMPMTIYTQSPNDRLDYSNDWTRWLNGDTISASSWSISPDGQLEVADGAYSPSNTTTNTRVWLAGGTAGNEYEVRNKITTTAGRIAERTFVVKVEQPVHT